jgi:hypothetical protein
VSDWQIRIPHQDPDQPVGELLGLVRRGIDDSEEQRVTRSLILDAASEFETAGELIRHVEGLDAADRRLLLDRARERAGLPPTGEVDRRREFVRAARDDPKPPPAPGPRRDASGAAIQRCAAAGCERLSANHAGYTAPTNVKRFWCADHADQAAPGDSEPFDANTVRVDPLTGRWLPPPEVEEHFERRSQAGTFTWSPRSRADGHRDQAPSLEGLPLAGRWTLQLRRGVGGERLPGPRAAQGPQDLPRRGGGPLLAS